MSWIQQLAILKMAGWQLKRGSKYWRMYKPNGDYYDRDTAKTFLIRAAFRDHMYRIGRTE